MRERESAGCSPCCSIGDGDRDKEESLCGEFVSVFLCGLVISSRYIE